MQNFSSKKDVYRKWYESTLLISLMLIISPPTGLFLMWIFRTDWNKALKIILSVVSSILLILYIVPSHIDNTRFPEKIQNTPIPTENSVSTMSNKNDTEKKASSDSDENLSISQNENTVQSEKNQANTDNETKADLSANENAGSNQSSDSANTVYITKSGKKYHNQNCRMLKGNDTPIDKQEAITNGYEPCKVCGG